MAAGSFLVEKDENPQRLFIMDALESITRAFACINMTQPETLATFDTLMKEAEEQSISFFLVAEERNTPLTTPVAALCIGNVLYNWEAAAPNFDSFQQSLRLLWKDDDDADSRILAHVIAVLYALAILEEESPASPQNLVRITNALKYAASELDTDGNYEEALACATSAINFAGLVSPIDGEAAGSFALSLAQRYENQPAIFMLLSQRAHFLARIAASDPAGRLAAFDAFETALGHVPADPALNKSMMMLLEGWINQEDYLHVLKPMLLLVSGSPRLSDPAMRAGIAAAVNTIWKGSLPDWVEHIEYVRALAIETANARVALMPKPEESIRTRWDTWSIEHTRLRRAIPHGTSIKREKLLHDILLEIGHEVTHVFSMFGFVGITLTAMRWALLEAELDVWGRVYYRQEKKFEEGFRVTPAPLEDADLISLGFAERAAEIERKIQLVENTWAPWFEGLAVFGELTADPQLDKDWQSPVAAAINNLWDRGIASQAEKENISIEEAYHRDQVETDALIATAIHSLGDYRMNTYLRDSRQKYLAGYMAVRSLVAQWRKTLGTPLRGDQAFRVLLHMTRFGDFAAFPDLSLPVEEFEKQVIERHIEWIGSMALVSKSDLEAILKQDTSPRNERKPTRWVNGKLDTSVIDEAFWDVIIRLANQLLNSLVGERANVERVPDADEICQATMAAVAEGLEGKKYESRLLKPDVAQHIFTRLVILPLAQNSSTFWLCEKDRMMACLICSREQDSESGKPSYDMVMSPLEEEDFLALQARIQKGGPRRMTTTRVIDLLNEKERYVGANFIAFQYEDWIYIQPRGMIFGLTTVEESLRSNIVSRLSPSPMIQDEEALTSESHPCVQRTISWIERNDWTNVDTEQGWSVDIDAWAQRVHKLGKQVLADNLPDVEKTSRAVLQFVFGDSELAKTIEADGFEALATVDPPVLQDFLKALLATATTPINDTQFELMNQAITETIGPLFEHTNNGWDVLSPKALERKES